MISQDRIEQLWYTNKSNAELRALLGVSQWALWAAKKEYRLPNRIAFVAGARPDRSRNDPDEATIAARCREIQAGWTPEERARRVVGGAR